MEAVFLCRPDTELLELDCIEMDDTMRHVFQKYASSEEIVLVDSRDKAIKCSIDRKQNLLKGRGLGRFIKSLKKSFFYLQPKDNGTFYISPENLCSPGYTAKSVSNPHIHFLMGEGKNNFKWYWNPGSLHDMKQFYIHQQALAFAVRPGFDTLLSLNVARNIEPYEYQIKTVKHVLQRMRGRALLADEVGLGKTIEAGLIMMEYIIRGLVKKVLILTPSSLVEQWQEEMLSKFNLDFISYDSPEFNKYENGWARFDRIIASVDKAKRLANRSLVCEAEYDMVIVDEAHHFKNRSTLGWQLINMLKKRYILLLTATPVENDLEELFNLITLLSPGQLDTAQNFRRRFISRGDRLMPRNLDSLKTLLKDVMVRNRRSDTNSITVKRYAEVVEIELSPPEKMLYDEITALVRNYFNSKEKTILNQFSLKTLQREVGSSAWAVAPTLEKMASHDENPPYLAKKLQQLSDKAREIHDNSKARALLKLLKNIDDKVIVFTGFQRTREYLVDFLQKQGFRVATLHGSMLRQEKEREVDDFRERARVLVSTESGGEGRNLQFCHVMVNFDLPWNPMRIEQRIGRLHRIGQKNSVFIYNLSAKDTIEAKILELLDAKINMFQLVVGELDMILGNLKAEKDFEDIIMEIWAESKTEEELSMHLEELGEQLASAKKHYEAVKNIDENLLGELLPDGE